MMAPGLRVGDTIRLRDDHGTEGTVVMLNGTNVTVLLTDGETVVLAFGQWYDKTGSGQVPLRLPIKPPGAEDSDLDVARELANHIIEVNTGIWPGASKARDGYEPSLTKLGEREELKIAELGGLPEGHPLRMKISMFRQYRKRYKEKGVPGLLDGRKIKSKSRFGRQDEQIVEHIRSQLVDQVDGTNATFKALYRRVECRIEEHNKQTGEDLECPAISTVRRIALNLPEGKYAFADATLRRSNNSSPSSGLVPFYASRPGDEVQIDATKLNVFVRDGDRYFRPELIVAVDVATRAVVAYRLTANAANGVDAAEILAKILTPEPFRPGWEERLRYGYESVPIERAIELDDRLQSAARIPVVFPSKLIIDNGKIFLSETFFHACDTFGVSVDFARPRTGHDKAIVERWFGTLDARFLEHIQHGYTARASHLRGAGEPNINGLYTLEQLDDLFAEFLVNYHDVPHSSLSLTLPYNAQSDVSPNDMYSFLVAAHGYLPQPASFFETIEVLPTIERQVHQSGVHFNGRVYDSPVLDHIREERNAQRGDKKWVFHYNSDETRFIYYQDIENSEVYAIPWTLNDRVTYVFNEVAWSAALKQTPQVLGPKERQLAAIEHLDKIMADRLANGEHGTARHTEARRDIELAAVKVAEPSPAEGIEDEMTDDEYLALLDNDPDTDQ